MLYKDLTSISTTNKEHDMSYQIVLKIIFQFILRLRLDDLLIILTGPVWCDLPG